MQHKGYRNVIRAFLRGVEWCDPQNVSILIHGHPGKANWAATELAEMAKVRRGGPAFQVKRLPSVGHRIYATGMSRKRDKGSHQIDHDVKLRNVLARFLRDRQYRGIEQLSVGRTAANADAGIGNLFFEMDNGHESPTQLREKILRYSGPGALVAIFIMASRYLDPRLEASRLDTLFEIGREILDHKPGRIWGGMYSQYLADGILLDLKGERR